MTESHIALLPDRGLVEVAGPDASEFLQGLITNDVDRAEGPHAIFGAMLTPQGKILFDFFILARGGDTYWLECGKDQAAPLTKRLSMYKLRAKVAIADRSEELAFAAAWGEASHELIAGVIAAYADPRFAPLGQRLILAADDQRVAEFSSSPSQYHQHRIYHAVPEAPADYQYGESFAHEASFDHLNGVDFTKGCFVGQEVVSRMHHRGTAKTRIAGIAGDAPLPETGTEIFAGELPAGRIGSVDGTRGIAMIRLDRAEKALSEGSPLTANGIAVSLRQPTWAKYQVPVGE